MDEERLDQNLNMKAAYIADRMSQRKATGLVLEQRVHLQSKLRSKTVKGVLYQTEVSLITFENLP